MREYCRLPSGISERSLSKEKKRTDGVHQYQEVSNKHGEEDPASPGVRVETIEQVCGKHSRKCHGLENVLRTSKETRRKGRTVENSYVLIPQPVVRLDVLKYV